MSHALLMGAEILGAVALIASGVGAAGGAGIISLSAATAATVSTIATFAAIGAAVAGVGAMALQKKPPETVNPMAWRPDPLAGVPEIMGRTYYGGNIVYRAAFDKDDVNETINTVYSIGPAKGMDTFYVDGVATTIDGGGQANILDRGKMYVFFQRGLQPEPAALGGTNNPGITTASKLSGLAASTITLSYDTTGGHTMTTEPQVGAVWEGTSVYDPRSDSTYPGGSGSQRLNDETTWSYTGFDNPGLRALTHLIGRRQNGKLIMGLGANPDALIISQFVECANICELNGWTMGGVQMSTDDKWDRLCDILQAGGAEPSFIGAQIGCSVNAPKVSLATVTMADVAGKCSVQATQPRKSRVNGIVGRYMAEQSLTVADTSQKAVNGVYPLKTTVTWGVAPAGVILVQDYVTFDGGLRVKQVDYPYVQGVADASGNAPNQLAQLVRYDIENAREYGPITLMLKLRWIGYRPGDVITVDIPELGLSNQDVLIRQRSPSLQSATVTLTCRSETAAKHPFALGQTTLAPPTPSVSGPALISTPGASAWALVGGTITSDSGTTIPVLQVTGAVDSTAVDAIIFEYRTSQTDSVAAGNWITVSTQPPAIELLNITGVQDHTAYDVAVSYRRGSGTGARLILGPATAGQTSVPWQAGVTGPGKPEDGATVGAPDGTDVGGVPAEDVIARIAATEALVAGLPSDVGDTIAAIQAEYRAGEVANLIRNGDFKDGLLYWAASSANWLPLSAPSVGTFVRHVSHDPSNGVAEAVYQDVNVIVGRQYSASFEANGYANDHAQQMIVNWVDASGNETDAANVLPSVANGWRATRYATGLLTAPPSAVKARIYLWINSQQGSFDATRVMFQMGAPTQWRDDASQADFAQRIESLSATVDTQSVAITSVETAAADASAAAAQVQTNLTAAAGDLQAQVTGQAGVLATLDGKTEAYLQITAVAGGDQAQLTIFADNGAGGHHAGVLLTGGDLEVDGDILSTGTVRAAKFVTDAGVDLAAIVPGSLNWRTASSVAASYGPAYQPDSGVVAGTSTGVVTTSTVVTLTAGGTITQSDVTGGSATYFMRVSLYYSLNGGAWTDTGIYGLTTGPGTLVNSYPAGQKWSPPGNGTIQFALRATGGNSANNSSFHLTVSNPNIALEVVNWK